MTLVAWTLHESQAQPMGCWHRTRSSTPFAAPLRGADYILECARVEETMQLGLEPDVGGPFVILSKTYVDEHVSFRFGLLMGEKRIKRSSNGGARPRRDFPWLASLHLKGELRSTLRRRHRASPAFAHV